MMLGNLLILLLFLLLIFICEWKEGNEPEDLLEKNKDWKKYSHKLGAIANWSTVEAAKRS